MSKALLKKELEKRLKQSEEASARPVFVLDQHCFPAQLEFVTDPSRFKTAVCSRRAGKSEACVADLIDNAIKFPDCNFAYITLARTSAKGIIWPLFKRVIRDYQIEVKYDNTDLNIEFPNGSIIRVGGAKDLNEVEKYRGFSYKKVYIDEAQSFRQSILQTLIEDVIKPALWDVNGTLCLIGTPGPIPNGLFYDLSHSNQWANHKWTMLDNPWIKKKSGREPADILAEERMLKGITEADPSYRREALGEWIQDLDALVYKFNFNKNVAETIPDKLTYVFGVDIGFNDSDAIAVLGYNYTDNNVYLVEEFIAPEQDITDLVNKIEELRDKYKPVRMVMDAGALGKKIQAEIQTRKQIPLETADKNRKLEYIKLMNDDLRSGKFRAFKGSRFAEECQLVVWNYDDPARPRISDKFHTDIGDAVLYAWRECMHSFAKTSAPKLEKNSNAYMDAYWAKEVEKLERAEKDAEWGITSDDIQDLFDDE